MKNHLCFVNFSIKLSVNDIDIKIEERQWSLLVLALFKVSAHFRNNFVFISFEYGHTDFYP